ncbi:MAG: 2-hydroxyacyl-CoA dehydratase, partial [Thermoanaerobaculia bacterium]
MSEATKGTGGTRKEQSMLLQKQMIGDHYQQLARAKEDGRKVVYTFVPGNLTELMRSFDLLPVLPEINALQSGMRKLSGDYVAEAEKYGHSEDVCTYVKCDIGMLKKGNVGPTGLKLPEPDLLLLSYTGCFTFMKWFELLRQEYDCPVVMLPVPYQAEGEIYDHHRDYIVEQLRSEVIPKMEEV